MGRDKHWPMPFQQRLEFGELRPGRAVGIKGDLKWHLGTPKFDAYLALGPNDYKRGHVKHDIALTVSYRGGHEGFVCNAHVGGRWGQEERFKGPTLKKDQEVYCRIECEEVHFKVFINGDHIGNFRYRVPLRDINHVAVEGDVDLNRVAMEGKYYMVPFNYKLNNFGPGRQLYITAKPEPNAETFIVELRHGHDEKEIPLHISVRFRDQVVVRNSKKHNKWEKEERHGQFPFYQGEDFDMIIDVYEDVYDIIINGRKFTSYKHRMSPRDVNNVNIIGDVELRSVYV